MNRNEGAIRSAATAKCEIKKGMLMNTRALSLALTVVLFAGCTAATPSANAPSGSARTTAPSAEIDPNGVLRNASTTTPTSFDPVRAASLSALQYLYPVYDTLIYADPNGKPEPMLATAWKYSDSPPAWVLTLRTGVKFHNGHPFDANVVKANIERDRAKGSLLASSLTEVSSVTVIDPSHVRFDLKAPAPDFLLTLADRAGLMADPAMFDSPDLATKGAGTGPFEVADFKPGAQVVYKRAASYWDPAASHLAELRWIQIDNDDARLNALITGQADVANLSPDQVKRAKDAGFVVAQGPILQTEHMRFNTARSEFTKEAVRQAINYAIDRKTLVDTVLENSCTVTSQYAPPGSIMHSDRIPDDHYKYDPSKAKELLAQAGVPNGFTFTALVIPQSHYLGYAQAIQAELAKVGVTMNLQPTSASDIVNAFYVRKVGDAIISGDVEPISPSEVARLNYLPTGTRNPGGGSTPEIEDLVKKVTTTADDKQRAQFWDQLTQAVTQYALTVQICRRTQSVAMNARVHGFENRVDGNILFRDVSMAKGT